MTYAGKVLGSDGNNHATLVLAAGRAGLVFDHGSLSVGADLGSGQIQTDVTATVAGTDGTHALLRVCHEGGFTSETCITLSGFEELFKIWRQCSAPPW